MDGDTPVIVEISPTDVAIYLWDATLVGPVSQLGVPVRLKWCTAARPAGTGARVASGYIVAVMRARATVRTT